VRDRARRLLAALLAAGLGLAAACGGRAPAPGPGGAQPSFVLILLDNLDETTSPYWEAMPKTRALLAERGRRFANAFVTDPICCPERASLLTGQYPHNHGVLSNGGPRGGWRAFRDGGGEARGFPVRLQQAGYRTALIGKYLNGYEQAPDHIPPGWSEWFVDIDTNIPMGFDYTVNDDGKLVYFGRDEAAYNTDVFAREAEDFIRRSAAAGRPFFAFLSITAPHLMIAAPPRYAGHRWEMAAVPERPNTYEADLSDKPEWLRRSEAARRRLSVWNERDYRNRMGSLLAVDDLVERVVLALEAAGVAPTTYVVFASDNGYNLGAHTLIHMMAPYDESLRIPLVVRGPGVPVGVEERMVLLMDLAPTFQELAGVAVPDWTDARSLAPLLRGAAPPAWRRDFLVRYETGWAHRGLGWGLPEPDYFREQILGGQDIPSYRALRNGSHTYIEWTYDEGTGPRREEELYDLEVDPYQLDNALATPAGRAAHADRVAGLRARLEALSGCAGESCRR
jgi:arylsulfatase A-like enzyme